MEHKSSLADCLKRSVSWSVNARFAAPDKRAVRLIRDDSRSRSTKASIPMSGKDAPPTVNQLVNAVLGRSRSKKSLDMKGLINSVKELDRTQTIAVDSPSLHSTALQEVTKKMKCLTRLDISATGLTELPESIGDLVKLKSLILNANELVVLPKSISKLRDLTVLRMEKNQIRELPWGIAQCKSLTELNANFNKLALLPDSMGQMNKLEILRLQFNCLSSLPKSMSGMASLIELDVSFNQLEDIPENLCLVTSLVRLSVASNFSDLKRLPESIGRLQKLRKFDVSFNAITHLPDSIAMLTNLHTLNLEGNPLLVPPLQIAEQGKEVALQFMIKYVDREEKLMKRSKKGSLTKLFYKFMRLIKKRNGKVNGDLLCMA